MVRLFLVVFPVSETSNTESDGRIQSKSSTAKYGEGWDAIFAKKDDKDSKKASSHLN